jgi:hypothetical protein
MGEISAPSPVLLIVAVSSRYPEALDWARQKTRDAWGPLALESPVFDFIETEYYLKTMGPDLKKVFFTYERLIGPGELPRIKHTTNQWEIDYAALGRHSEPRPLNLDPGYVTTAKLVLASTKDHSHRLYMADGIYAEMTLHYKSRRWQPSEWTYPDYRRDDYQAFFIQAREYLHRREREMKR